MFEITRVHCILIVGIAIILLPTFAYFQVLSAVLACLVVLQLIFQEQDGYGCDQNRTISPAAYTAVALKFATFVSTPCRPDSQQTCSTPVKIW